MTSSSRITTCRVTRCQTPSPLSTPSAPDDESPFKDLCGAGVAFKLCAALEGCDPAELLEMYGELAALGTVADACRWWGRTARLSARVCPFCRTRCAPPARAFGERRLRRQARHGGHGQLQFGPALERCGPHGQRRGSAQAAALRRRGSATGIAERLAEINTERQQTEQQVFAAALQALEADPARTRDRVLVVSGEDWHPGASASWRRGSWSGSAARSSSSRCTRARAAAAGAHRTRSTCTVRSPTAHSI